MSETSATGAGVVAAGWYQATGHAEGVLRYWDGTQWTEHFHDARPVLLQPYPPVHQQVIVHQDRGRKVNHFMHFCLTVLTLGLWLPVWLIVAIAKN